MGKCMCTLAGFGVIMLLLHQTSLNLTLPYLSNNPNVTLPVVPLYYPCHSPARYLDNFLVPNHLFKIYQKLAFKIRDW